MSSRLVGAKTGADAAVEDAFDSIQDTMLGFGDLRLRVALGFGFLVRVGGDGGVDGGLVDA